MSRSIPFISGRHPKAFALRGKGFEVVNGPQRFNRVLYGALLPEQPHRARFLTGDLPEVLVHLMGDAGRLLVAAGLPGEERWLTKAAQVRALYIDGAMEYEVRDPSLGSGRITLTVVPLSGSAGMAVRLTARDVPAGIRLVVAFGAASGRNNLRAIDAGYTSESFTAFDESNCRGNRFEYSPRLFYMTSAAAGSHRICGRFSWDGTFRNVAPEGYARGPGLAPTVPEAVDCFTVYETTPGSAPWEGYMILTVAETENPLTAGEGREYFECSLSDRAAVADTARVSTPDPLWSAAMAASCIAADATWIPPVFVHGAWSWDLPILGWRSLYGPIAIGWHDRVMMEAKLFTGLQLTEDFTMADPSSQARFLKPAADGDYFIKRRGATEYKMVPEPDAESNLTLQSYASVLSSPGLVPYMPDKFNKPRYNMQEVFFDQLLHLFLWSGDRDYLAMIWPAVKRHLGWEKRCFDGDNDGLYENFANFWASDGIWASGGGCALASAYNYRANRLAAELAALMGEDPAPFTGEAEKIRAAVRSRLWLKPEGHLAEWVDALGNKQLHTSLSLPTIVHVVESGLLDPFEVYQLLRTTRTMLKREPSAEGGELIWNTNWVPYTWSVRDIDYADNFHAALCYFLNGQADEGYELLRAQVSESTCHSIAPGGLMCVYEGKSVDFSDTVSMCQRAIIEGLFGIRPRLHEGLLLVAPGFPAGWTEATLTLTHFSLAYRKEGAVETFIITSTKPCALRLRIPVSTSGLVAATVDGHPVQVRHVAAIGRAMVELDGEEAMSWTVVVTSSGEPLTPLALAPAAVAGGHISLRPGDEALALFDPQGVLEPGAAVVNGALCGTVSSMLGHHTFFVQAKQGEAVFWQPVDVEIVEPLRVEGARWDARNGCICLRLCNSTDRPLNLTAQLEGTSECFSVGSRAASRELAFVPAAPLTPGTSTFLLDLQGDMQASLKVVVVDWSLPLAASLQRPLDMTELFNLRLGDIFRQYYLSPRSPFCSVSTPVHLFPSDWCRTGMDGVKEFNDLMLRDAVSGDGIFTVGCGVRFRQVSEMDALNVAMVSLWDNFPAQVEVALMGTARKVYCLIAGYTNQMQCDVVNAVIEVEYADGSCDRFPLVNPYDFRSLERGPSTERAVDEWCHRGRQLYRVQVGDIKNKHLMGFEGTIEADGAFAQVLDRELSHKPLRALRLRAVANDVVVGLLGVTLQG